MPVLDTSNGPQLSSKFDVGMATSKTRHQNDQKGNQQRSRVMERGPWDNRVNEIIWWFSHIINDQIDTILFDLINDKHFIDFDNVILTLN
jgi:hypothetical protein